MRWRGASAANGASLRAMSGRKARGRRARAAIRFDATGMAEPATWRFAATTGRRSSEIGVDGGIRCPSSEARLHSDRDAGGARHLQPGGSGLAPARRCDGGEQRAAGEQALAQIVAKNLAVEVLTDPEPPAFGAARGEAVNAGRRWRWTRQVTRSPEARIQQIEIAVEPEAGGPGRARLTLFRRGPCEARRGVTSGFTLVEMLIALTIFGMITAAGVALADPDRAHPGDVGAAARRARRGAADRRAADRRPRPGGAAHPSRRRRPPAARLHRRRRRRRRCCSLWSAAMAARARLRSGSNIGSPAGRLERLRFAAIDGGGALDRGAADRGRAQGPAALPRPSGRVARALGPDRSGAACRPRSSWSPTASARACFASSSWSGAGGEPGARDGARRRPARGAAAGRGDRGDRGGGDGGARLCRAQPPPMPPRSIRAALSPTGSSSSPSSRSTTWSPATPSGPPWTAAGTARCGSIPLPGGAAAEIRLRDGGNCFNLNSVAEGDVAHGARPAARPAWRSSPG